MKKSAKLLTILALISSTSFAHDCDKGIETKSTSNYKTTNQIKKGIKNATNEENELHKTQINTTTSNYSNYYRLRHK